MSDRCILAVDAGGTSLKAALADQSGELLSGSFMQVPVASAGSCEEIAEAYRLLARTAAEMAYTRALEIVKVGVCIPGPFDYEDGISRMTHKYKEIFGVPMRPWFEESLGEVPISFLHDSTAFLLGAVTEQDLRAHSRICGVIIGTGLGFAAMLNGKMFLNEKGGPGISIFSRPYRDAIAEEYVSKRAVENRYRSFFPNNPCPTVAEIAGRAFAGEPQARQCFEEMGADLGGILRSIVVENSFTLLLLGGAISKSADLYLPALREALSGIPIEVRAAAHIDEAPLLGAARV